MTKKEVFITRFLNLIYIIPAIAIIFTSYPKEISYYDPVQQHTIKTMRISSDVYAKSMFSLDEKNSYMLLKWASAPFSYALFAFAVSDNFNPNITPWPFYFIMCGCIFLNIVILNVVLIVTFNRRRGY